MEALLTRTHCGDKGEFGQLALRLRSVDLELLARSLLGFLLEPLQQDKWASVTIDLSTLLPEGSSVHHGGVALAAGFVAMVGCGPASASGSDEGNQSFRARRKRRR